MGERQAGRQAVRQAGGRQEDEGEDEAAIFFLQQPATSIRTVVLCADVQTISPRLESVTRYSLACDGHFMTVINTIASPCL